MYILSAIALFTRATGCLPRYMRTCAVNIEPCGRVSACLFDKLPMFRASRPDAMSSDFLAIAHPRDLLIT